MTFIFLLQVTKVLMHRTQIIVTICHSYHIIIFRSELFQTNGLCMILSLICLLQVTMIMMHST